MFIIFIHVLYSDITNFYLYYVTYIYNVFIFYVLLISFDREKNYIIIIL